MLPADPGRPVTELLLRIGRLLPRRRDARGYLIVEALVAARRDEDVARLMRDYVGERGDWLPNWCASPKPTGSSTRLSPSALAHFCLLLSMGSALDHAGPPRGDRGGVGRVAHPGGGRPRPDRRYRTQNSTTGTAGTANSAVKVQIDPGPCQGHGRCYDLAPGLFGDDDEGYGQVLGDGIVPREASATRAWPRSTAPNTR